MKCGLTIWSSVDANIALYRESACIVPYEGYDGVKDEQA